MYMLGYQRMRIVCLFTYRLAFAEVYKSERVGSLYE